MDVSPNDIIPNILAAEGFDHYGYARLIRPLSFDQYKKWIEEGCNGEMMYLKTHMPFKEVPQKLIPLARSAIVICVSYLPHPRPLPIPPLTQAPIALYAQGEDYHHWLLDRLQQVCHRLKERFPNDHFFPMTDSKPVLERDLAERAGLGWIGKNTCLLNRHQGSFTFLGEIYTSLLLQETRDPHPKHCGSCRRCLDVCPTGALASQWLDARKCISYLNIESKTVPPRELRLATGQFFFGCDLCQTVCPWNQKVYKGLFDPLQLIKNYSYEQLSEEMCWILSASNSQLKARFINTPLSRAGSFGLRRNAMLVAAHYELKTTMGLLSAFYNHPKLGELARWTFELLNRQSSRDKTAASTCSDLGNEIGQT